MPVSSRVSPGETIRYRSEPQGVHVHLPATTVSWTECWTLLGQTLAQQRWQRPYPVTLWAEDWVLDQEHLQWIAERLAAHNLIITKVQTRQRLTAIAAATLAYSVDQGSPWQPPSVPRDPSPLYIQATVRSGTEIRHSSSVIIWGDVNPGAEIRAEGDILVWGRLRGVIHAGCGGSQSAVILALQMEPTQLRIADQVARSPDPHQRPIPEVAYLRDNKICIATISEYLRQRS